MKKPEGEKKKEELEKKLNYLGSTIPKILQSISGLTDISLISLEMLDPKRGWKPFVIYDDGIAWRLEEDRRTIDGIEIGIQYDYFLQRDRNNILYKLDPIYIPKKKNN